MCFVAPVCPVAPVAPVAWIPMIISLISFVKQAPTLWPETFGYHEFFHLCTVIASFSLQARISFAVDLKELYKR